MSADVVGRLILRFLLVPVGAVVALVIAALTLVAANRTALQALADSGPQQASYFVFALPLLIFDIAIATVLMMLPAAVGAFIAEAFALRSGIYHALNGGLSIWIGWSAFGNIRAEHTFLDNPMMIVAAGIAAGFAYWMVAGWSAGFWKPVFRRAAELVPAVKP